MNINGFILDELSEKIYLNKESAEGVLLDAVASCDEESANNAKYKLIQVYGTGKYTFPGDDPWDIPGFPNLDKLKEFVSKEIRCSDDISEMLDALYHDFMDIDETVASAVEAALLAVECSETCDLFFDADGREEAKITLFWLYFKGEFGYSDCEMITLPSLMDTHKAAELLRYEVITNCDYNPDFFDYHTDGAFDEIWEQAYTLYPTFAYVARDLFERRMANGEIDNAIAIVRSADSELARAILSDILSDTEFFFGDENEEEAFFPIQKIEELFLTLGEKGECPELPLSLYQHGCIKYYAYTIDFPMLQNPEKAAAFAKAQGMELSTEPCDIDC